MKDESNRANNLHSIAQFSLFITSYLPLFLLIVLHQFFQNHEYIKWGGLSLSSVKIFVSKFGLSVILTAVSLLGWFGYRQTFKAINELSANGFPVIVKDVKNKSSESIGYIATYIIPFLFQDFNDPYQCVAVSFLLLVIYRIYINSTLLLVNPVLSMWYSIYEIEFEDNGLKRNGLVITGNRYLQEEDKIVIYSIGHRLYFSQKEVQKR